jgi:hypothetical protein
MQKEKKTLSCKKELEFYLKQIKPNLEDNPAVPVSNEMDHSSKLNHIKLFQPRSMRVCHVNQKKKELA